MMNLFQATTTTTTPLPPNGQIINDDDNHFEPSTNNGSMQHYMFNDKYFPSNHHHHHHHHQYGQIPQHPQQSMMMANVDQNHHNSIINEQQQPMNGKRNPFISRSHCVVCGDRARGCNFGAITCASCKEFFRRNAFKTNKLKCYFQLKCEINVHSRRFCAPCRLAKCYSMGMKSEYIMSEAQKQERNMKIYERKLSNVRHMNNHNHHVDNHYSHHHDQSQYHQSDIKMMMMNNDNCSMNRRSSSSSSSVYNESVYDEKSMNETTTTTISTSIMNNGNDLIVLDSNSSGNNSNDSIDSQEIIAYHHDVHHHHHRSMTSRIPTTEVIEINDDDDNDESQIINKEEIDRQNMADERLIKLMNKVKIIRESGYSVTKFHLLLRATSSKHPRNVLTEHFSCKLRYLTSIVQILSAETISDLPTDQKFIDLIRIAEIELSQEDQIALVKGNVMDTLIIWSMMTINLEKECWEAMDLERNFRFTLKMEMLKEANPKLYEKHRSYVMSFEPEWRYNDYLMSLLIAIALFNPKRPNICNVQKIRNERNIYCNLMKQYLDTLNDEPRQSQESYDRLMDQLRLTEKISEYHMKTYFNLNTNEATKNGYGGLIMEIDNLNNIPGVKTKRCCI